MNICSDAMIIVDPRTHTILDANIRANELAGIDLATGSISTSEVFQNENDDFHKFILNAATVTKPVISSIKLRTGDRKISAKANRISKNGDAPLVALVLSNEAMASQRFRLLTEKVEELRAEVRRRKIAEKRNLDNMQSLERSVSVIKQISELDISSGEYLDLTALAVSSSLGSRGTAIISVEAGRLKVLAATGVFSNAYEKHQNLDLSLADLGRMTLSNADHWKNLILTNMDRSSAYPLDLENCLVLPLSVTGELRGALICSLDPATLNSARLNLEGNIISDAIGSLIARAEIEQRLIHSQKLQAIGQLTGGIAHDFNNILAVILGNAELILEETDQIDFELANEIRLAALKGASLTSRLLSFARKQPLRPEKTDANKLIREFDPIIRRTIKESIDYELISAGGIWKMQVDRSQLENALLNLTVNARDAMPNGGKLTIETANVRLDQDYADQHTEVRPGQYVMVAVSDTGHGMDQQVLREAFTPFFTTKAVGKGSGLGLSMVFGFVKQSLGHVKIYSESGLGTTVRMYFPRDISEAMEFDENKTLKLDYSAVNKGFVLVVEDDPGVLRYLKKSLEMLGYRVEGVTTGDEAVEHLKRKTYDLLLTDVVLPGKHNGAQVAQFAGEIAPNFPILFMSGYTENAIVHHGRLDPGVNFISKPFTRDQLAKRLKSMAEQ
jgi:signal transduction histidine kinase/CheY-like chemotaxis protein